LIESAFDLFLLDISLFDYTNTGFCYGLLRAAYRYGMIINSSGENAVCPRLGQ